MGGVVGQGDRGKRGQRPRGKERETENEWVGVGGGRKRQTLGEGSPLRSHISNPQTLWGLRRKPREKPQAKSTQEGRPANPGRMPPWEPAQLRLPPVDPSPSVAKSPPPCGLPGRLTPCVLAHTVLPPAAINNGPSPPLHILLSLGLPLILGAPGRARDITCPPETPLPQQAGPVSPEGVLEPLTDPSDAEAAGLDLSPQWLSPSPDHPGPKQPHGVP